MEEKGDSQPLAFQPAERYTYVGRLWRFKNQKGKDQKGHSKRG